jgi:hypothetical protein
MLHCTAPVPEVVLEQMPHGDGLAILGILVFAANCQSQRTESTRSIDI